MRNETPDNPIPMHYGRIERGPDGQYKIHFSLPKGFQLWLARCYEKGKRVRVAVWPETEPPTLQQRRYYHGVVLKLLGDSCGMGVGETKEAVRAEVFGAIGMDPDTSTESLTRAQYGQIIEETKRIAGKLGVRIPEPDHVHF